MINSSIISERVFKLRDDDNLRIFTPVYFFVVLLTSMNPPEIYSLPQECESCAVRRM